jgi:hypothetical protein
MRPDGSGERGITRPARRGAKHSGGRLGTLPAALVSVWTQGAARPVFRQKKSRPKGGLQFNKHFTVHYKNCIIRSMATNNTRKLKTLWEQHQLGAVDAFEELLRHFPTEEMVDEDDPAYLEVEADSGCRTCANGDPCQVRIEADIADILGEAGLTDAEKLPCLVWMIEEGCSSLTQSIQQIAEAFTAYLAKAASEPTALPVNLARSARALRAGIAQE